MQQAQRRVVQEAWDRRAPDLPLQSPEQLRHARSIIEKETGRSDERSRVAAVFVNRLKQKMKLQSDPTIIYGLVGGKGTLGRPIMRSEIKQPTPYNTYVINGLPPGPIANPGRAALEAAANPSRTRELYFVADGTGGHAFAENYEQHQRNVAQAAPARAAAAAMPPSRGRRRCRQHPAAAERLCADRSGDAAPAAAPRPRSRRPRRRRGRASRRQAPKGKATAKQQ